jgi:putative transposase
LVATSDYLLIPNKTHVKYFDKEINKLKSRRDKLKKHSRNWKRVNKTIKQLYVVKTNKVKDFLHKVSKRISNIYDIVVVEDLSLKKMSESKVIGLNRELRNSQLGNFISMLEYKSKKLIKVDPYNTSKKCSECGNLHDMPLSKRVYRCDCGLTMDRDINASLNILCLGQAILNSEKNYEYSNNRLLGNLVNLSLSQC